MSRYAAAEDPLHVLYVGSSVDLGALRRLMEAHGAVTRSRLTPEVTVVVADSSVPATHPAVRDAGTLGIPVIEPDEAIVQFAEWRSRTELDLPTQPTPPTQPTAGRPSALPRSAKEPIQPATVARRSWPFRRSAS
ncbi:MAG: BRCT domain-containing protein [Pseudonocardiaceae bacterium]